MYRFIFSARKNTRPKAVETADVDLARVTTGLKTGVKESTIAVSPR
jgi:hypothetical protein